MGDLSGATHRRRGEIGKDGQGNPIGVALSTHRTEGLPTSGSHTTGSNNRATILSATTLRDAIGPLEPGRVYRVCAVAAANPRGTSSGGAFLEPSNVFHRWITEAQADSDTEADHASEREDMPLVFGAGYAYHDLKVPDDGSGRLYLSLAIPEHEVSTESDVAQIGTAVYISKLL